MTDQNMLTVDSGTLILLLSDILTVISKPHPISLYSVRGCTLGSSLFIFPYILTDIAFAFGFFFKTFSVYA